MCWFIFHSNLNRINAHSSNEQNLRKAFRADLLVDLASNVLVNATAWNDDILLHATLHVVDAHRLRILALRLVPAMLRQPLHAVLPDRLYKFG